MGLIAFRNFGFAKLAPIELDWAGGRENRMLARIKVRGIMRCIGRIFSSCFGHGQIIHTEQEHQSCKQVKSQVGSTSLSFALGEQLKFRAKPLILLRSVNEILQKWLSEFV
jgi:hypothetical protein